MSSPAAEPAQRVISRAVASTCDLPYCNPGFSRVAVAFSASLSRAQQVPSIFNAGGTATFSFNSDRTELTYEIRVQGIPNVAASHFHNAAAGANGGVVRALSGVMEGDEWVSAGTWSSSEADQPLSPDLVSEVDAGNIYVNIHTADYGAGEIRGQVVTGDAGLTATLDRSQEVPSIPVSGGIATFSLSADRTTLSYDIRVVGVPNVAAAHFHNAATGTNGGVVRGLVGSIEDGVWVSVGTWSADEAEQPFTADLMKELVALRLYVNIHTADYGPGEVRGQILR